MKKNYPKEGFLYKRNLKIHRNLWIPYTVALIISIGIIVIKGIV
ncbi:hypothetical protein [Malaciobacter marinus]|nr:hypothetical protein [Malaciobacter marinus]